MSLRLRLALLYGGLLLVAMALVLGVSYWLVGRHLDRTLPAADAQAALQQLGVQYALALAASASLLPERSEASALLAGVSSAAGSSYCRVAG